MPQIGDILYIIDEDRVVRVRVIDTYGESGVIAQTIGREKTRIYAEGFTSFFRLEWKAKYELKKRRRNEKGIH